MFFDNFERICKERGTSPSAVVSEIGKSKNTASNWKKFGTIPKNQELEDLAFVLKCKVSDFFSDPVDKFEAEQSADLRQVLTIMGDRLVEENLTIDDNIYEFIRIYSRCKTIRQRHQLMDAVYDFEDKVLSAKEEPC